MDHLEKTMENAQSPATIAGVYWSARDLSGAFYKQGNHHFLSFVYIDENEAKLLKDAFGLDYFHDTNGDGNVFYFATVGLSIDSDGNITTYANDADDKQAIHEAIDSDNRTFWKPDFDYEAHRVDFTQSSRGYGSCLDLMIDICDLRRIFVAKYEHGDRIGYSLKDENCAAFVNSVLEAAGFSGRYRESLGEFDGIDWGEEDPFPEGSFELDYGPYVPQGDFRTTSRGITVVLSATCSTRRGKTKTSTFDLTRTGWLALGNDDGDLVVESRAPAPDPFSCLPGGSYLRSSTDMTVTLTALCRTGSGGWRKNSVVLEQTLPQRFTNLDGVLTPE